MDEVLQGDARALAALITAAAALSVAVAGPLVNALLVRGDRRRERRERRVDLQVALRAEIVANLHQLGDEAALERTKTRVLERMDEDESYMPFAPHQTRDRVYGAMIGRIDLLPTEGVEAVVFYYDQLTATERLAEDLRAPEAAMLPRRAQRRMAGHYMDMQAELLRAGRAARTVLDQGIEADARWRN